MSHLLTLEQLTTFTGNQALDRKRGEPNYMIKSIGTLGTMYMNKIPSMTDGKITCTIVFDNTKTYEYDKDKVKRIAALYIRSGLAVQKITDLGEKAIVLKFDKLSDLHTYVSDLLKV